VSFALEEDDPLSAGGRGRLGFLARCWARRSFFSRWVISAEVMVEGLSVTSERRARANRADIGLVALLVVEEVVSLVFFLEFLVLFLEFLEDLEPVSSSVYLVVFTFALPELPLLDGR